MNGRNLKMLFLLCLLVSCSAKRTTNWSVGLQREGRDPYDLYLGYHSLGYFYPDAGFSVLNSTEALEKTLDADRGGQSLMVLVGKGIQLSQAERESLLGFVGSGNELVFFSGDIDEGLLHQFGLREISGSEMTPLSEQNPGSANKGVLSLDVLPDKRFGFFGRNFRGYFMQLDDADTSFQVLGRVQRQEGQVPNIYRIPYREGHITLVATPLILSNYFLLQTNNREYLQVFWQQIGDHFDNIYWGNYQHRNPDMSSWKLLMSHPAVRMAVLIALLLMLAYLLVEVRRKQREVPEIKPVENSYASFVETVGMLYYSHHDNANLCRKLEQHFLEWVRLRYHLPTEVLDDKFVQLLSGKSGVGTPQTESLISMIHELRTSSDPITDQFLFDFYTAIHVFYTINTQDGNRF